MLALHSGPCVAATSHRRPHTAASGISSSSTNSSAALSSVRRSAVRTMLPAGGAFQQPRRSFSVAAMFGFKWPFGGSEESKGGKYDDILKSARQPRKRGCELAPREAPEGLKLATVGGGCFWGLELAFQRVPGVVKTTVGYSGGKAANPTYEEVCMGFTGHTEVVQCTYDPDQVTYRQLLDVFFNRVDPTTLNRQGNDRGTQYRSAVYTHDEEQLQQAQQKIAEVNEQLSQGLGGVKWLGRKVVTELAPCGDYYLAEAYHQQYLEKGGRMGRGQSAAKGCTDPIRCYG